jgi:hypothetical protein
VKTFKALVLTVLFLVCLMGTHVEAAPIDLGAFTTDPGVTVNSGIVSFSEDINYAAIYLYDDAFLVPNNATILSFNYDLILGQTDINDYLSFEIDFVPIQTITTSGSGYFEVDLTSYRAQPISLAWGLIWGGEFDDQGTATATVSNIDLATQANSVPEPSVLLLLLLGGSPLGLYLGLKRKVQA